MKNNKSLHFETYEKAAEWFDTHDMADYEDQLKPVDFHFDLRKNRNWVELDIPIAKRVRNLAKKRHTSTHDLVNNLLKEKLSSMK